MKTRNRTNRTRSTLALAAATLLTLGVGASAFALSEKIAPPLLNASAVMDPSMEELCPPNACTVVYKTDKGGQPSALTYR